MQYHHHGSAQSHCALSGRRLMLVHMHEWHASIHVNVIYTQSQAQGCFLHLISCSGAYLGHKHSAVAWPSYVYTQFSPKLTISMAWPTQLLIRQCCAGCFRLDSRCACSSMFKSGNISFLQLFTLYLFHFWPPAVSISLSRKPLS